MTLASGARGAPPGAHKCSCARRNAVKPLLSPSLWREEAMRRIPAAIRLPFVPRPAAIARGAACGLHPRLLWRWPHARKQRAARCALCLVAFDARALFRDEADRCCQTSNVRELRQSTRARFLPNHPLLYILYRFGRYLEVAALQFAGLRIHEEAWFACHCKRRDVEGRWHWGWRQWKRRSPFVQKRSWRSD